MPNKKTFVVVIIIIAVVLLVGGGAVWYKNAQEYVKRGLAKSDFPYTKYSQDELNSLYPQYVENNTPTTQTPEETHKKFVEALKKQDFEEAVGCCVVESERKDLKESLLQIKNDNLLSKMISDLDVNLKQLSIDSSKAVYSYNTFKDGKQYGHKVYFLKDSKGVWLVESL